MSSVTQYNGFIGGKSVHTFACEGHQFLEEKQLWAFIPNSSFPISFVFCLLQRFKRIYIKRTVKKIFKVKLFFARPNSLSLPGRRVWHFSYSTGKQALTNSYFDA